MAKTTIRDSFNIQAQMQASLKEAGIENRAALDRLMSSTTIEKILSDAPAVYNYQSWPTLAFWASSSRRICARFEASRSRPQEYRRYFDNQIPNRPRISKNVIPYQDIFSPQVLGR